MIPLPPRILRSPSDLDASEIRALSTAFETPLTGTTIRTIIGNDHTVNHNKSICSAFNNQTYSLIGGSHLKTANKTIRLMKKQPGNYFFIMNWYNGWRRLYIFLYTPKYNSS